MGTSYPIRAGVDSAEALTFPEIRRFTISATVQHRGRQLTITSEGFTADELCDLLDKRFGSASAAPAREEHAAPQPLSAPPTCPVHRKAMKPMKYPSRQGHQWHCTAKVGDDWCEERA